MSSPQKEERNLSPQVPLEAHAHGSAFGNTWKDEVEVNEIQEAAVEPKKCHETKNTNTLY